MSESSDTGQASIVFLGRESFRMQVVGAGADGTNVGAIPSAIWEGPTARIIERRNFERRHARRGEPDAVTPPPVPARKNMVIGISLLTFACGVAVATAANQLPRSTSARLTQIERRQPAMPATRPAPAIIIQPLAKVVEEAAPEPAAAAIASPLVEPRSAEPRVIAKAAPTPRAVAARVTRPRRPAPAVGAADLEADDPFQAPPARPAPRNKWVDPFAE